MELGVNSFEVRESHRLAKDHLVEARNEVRIQETTMEYRQANDATDELEVAQVVGVDT